MKPDHPTFDPARYFDRDLARRYDQGIRLSCPGYDALHRMLPPLLQLLPEQARFLSAGCGTGGEIRALAARFARWQFTGVDVSPDMLEACRRESAGAGIAQRVQLVNARMEDFRATEPFDAAASIFVMHFIRDRAARLAYLRALAAALKPGGVLVLGDVFGDTTSPEFVELMKAWLLYYVAEGANAQKLTADLRHIFDNMVFTPEAELRAQLADAGFTGMVRFHQSYLFGAWVAHRAAAEAAATPA